MRAMILDALGQSLRGAQLPIPKLEQLLIRVHAYGICRDIQSVDGELTQPKLLLVPGDQRRSRWCSLARTYL